MPDLLTLTRDVFSDRVTLGRLVLSGEGVVVTARPCGSPPADLHR
jgi:hypothetical protein